MHCDLRARGGQGNASIQQWCLRRHDRFPVVPPRCCFYSRCNKAVSSIGQTAKRGAAVIPRFHRRYSQWNDATVLRVCTTEQATFACLSGLSECAASEELIALPLDAA